MACTTSLLLATVLAYKVEFCSRCSPQMPISVGLLAMLAQDDVDYDSGPDAFRPSLFLIKRRDVQHTY